MKHIMYDLLHQCTMLSLVTFCTRTCHTGILTKQFSICLKTMYFKTKSEYNSSKFHTIKLQLTRCLNELARHQPFWKSVCYWIFFLKLYNIFEISVQGMQENLDFICLFQWLLVGLLLCEEGIQSLNPNSWRPSVMPWRSPFRCAQGTQKCPWSQNL